MKIKALALLLASLLCSGCTTPEKMELGDRLIIEAIGVDDEEDEFIVTVQTLDTRQTGSASSSDSSDSVTKIYTARGTTIAEAFSRISLLSGQNPMYSQTRILVLGKKIAEKKMEQTLDFFIREYTTRDDVLVACAEDKAADIVSIDLGKSIIAAEILQQAVEAGDFNARTVRMPLYEFVNYLFSDTDAAYLPVLAVTENNKGEPEIDCPGTAVFAHDALTVILSQRETAGLLWATDKIDNGTVHISVDDIVVAVEITGNKTRRSIREENGRLICTVSCSFDCDIVEFDGPIEKSTKRETIEQIENAAEAGVRADIAAMLQKTCFENGCDVLRTGRMLMQKEPSLYADFVAHREEGLRNTVVLVGVECNVRRSGRETLPLADDEGGEKAG